MNNKKPNISSPILLILMAAILVFVFITIDSRKDQNGSTDLNSAYGSNAVRAKVLAITEEGTTKLGEIEQAYQVFDVEIMEGEFKGVVTSVDYGLRQIASNQVKIQPNEVLLVSVGVRPDTGEVRAFFTDFVRSKSILYLFLVFVFFSILISGWKGVRSLIAILFSLGVIVFFILPQILGGRDPVLVSIIGAFVFLSISQYLVYGWNLKTHSAVIGILISLILTGIISAFFINFTRLTGFGDENAMFLVQVTSQNINMRGLLLAGMIIGALGVLDDLVISQASAIFELHAVNPDLGFTGLYHRAMNIGRDHVAATINTLVLAYAGASLPMLLLFSISNQNPAMLINISFIAEEIVRTLVGSIGLIASIPITTGLAAIVATQHQKFPWMEKFLGPDNQGQGHSH
ncbi:MAG: YibE/F family protein [Chloroflexi bacterium HGW-Chloroflexi-8]|nr:MAG: YibE/F family protein [Chloroflexi bacterium HGW-Chloroflexi-8]